VAIRRSISPLQIGQTKVGFCCALTLRGDVDIANVPTGRGRDVLELAGMDHELVVFSSRADAHRFS
jgi:hypothetical protein